MAVCAVTSAKSYSRAYWILPFSTTATAHPGQQIGEVDACAPRSPGPVRIGPWMMTPAVLEVGARLR